MPVYAAGPPDLEVRRAMSVPASGTQKPSPPPFPMEDFLDRLMAAESGGHLRRKNPRSTALGPFQFIKSTFLFVASKHFPSEIAGFSEKQILALRTSMAFSRRAAAAYTGDLIAVLKDSGLPATTANVRLAFLVGPVAAVRLLKAPPDQPLKGVLSADAIAANPFMSGATVASLVRKAAADVSATAEARRLGGLEAEPPIEADLDGAPTVVPVALEDEPAVTAVGLRGERPVTSIALQHEPPTAVAPVREPTPIALSDRPPTPTGAPYEIKCEIGLASCRRWLALQERNVQLARGAQR
jgi:hypothetical protein